MCFQTSLIPFIHIIFNHLELGEFVEWGLPGSLNVPNDTCLFQLPVLCLSLLLEGAEGGLALLGEVGEDNGLSPLSPNLEPGLFL